MLDVRRFVAGQRWNSMKSQAFGSMGSNVMKVLKVSFLQLSVMLPLLLVAQNTSSITGIATDPSGAVVQGAEVTVTNQATNLARTVATNASGFYSVTNLMPGVYTVTLEKAGFSTLKIENTPLTVAQALVLNAKLSVGSVQQAIEVNGAAVGLIDIESTQLSTLVDSKTMSNLPLLTRNAYELVLLSPGVIQPNNGSNGFAVNGSRDRNNNFLLDGVDNNDPSVPGRGSGIIGINPDSAQEFRVITNTFDPEFGRNTGAIIDVVTRSGANKFHGDAYWFGRYNALGARDFFNRAPNAQNPAPNPQNPYVRNDFGYSLGGPIIKDRTFFFINNEYQRFRTTLTATATVPTAAFKSGFFTAPDGTQVDLRTATSPGNLSGLSVDPTVSKVLSLLPIPNAGDVIPGLTGILNFASPDRLNSYTWTGKIDHKLTERHQLTLRYAFNRIVSSNLLHSETAPGIDVVGLPIYSHGVFGGLTSTLSHSLVNDFKFGWNKVYFALESNCADILNPITGTDALGNGRDFVPPEGNLGRTFAIGCASLFFAKELDRNSGTTSYADIITWVKGNHTVKFGGDFRNVRATTANNGNSRDALAFNRFQNSGGADLAFAQARPDQATQDLAWFLVGGVSTQFQAQFFNKTGTRVPTDGKTFRQHETDGFIQDTWKIRSNLTLNYGLRYQFNGVPFETGGNFSNLFQNADSFATSFTFTEVGASTGHDMFNSDNHNLEPRVGFAWDPYKEGKTSVRGDYGIFHDRIFEDLFGIARGNPPFQQTVFNVFSGTSTPETVPFAHTTPPSLTVVNGQNQSVFLLDPDIKMPQSQNWTFGIQHELSSNLVLELNYVGAHATHVIRLVSAVPPDPVLVQQAIADCVAAGSFINGGCDPGDPQGKISSAVLLVGIPQIGVPPSIRETALATPASPGSNITRTNSDAHYHSLQWKATKRLSHGLQFGGAYTWSHATDDSNDPLTPEAGGLFTPVDSRNPNLTFRGNSDNDIRHRAVVNFSDELPFGTGKKYLKNGILGKALEGIAISGIVSAQTGHPYSILTQLDNGRNGLTPSWPDVIGDPSNNPGPRIQAAGVKTGVSQAAFSSGFLGHIGDSGRNQFYGPHYINADMVLMKNIRFIERYQMEIRSEFFNIFNHPQFGQPGNIIENPGTFGLSTQTITRPDGTTSARQIQLALKLIF
jgi:Carboxypeptidase regulatory-like domain